MRIQLNAEPHAFTCDEFLRLVEAGIVRSPEPLELLEGWVLSRDESRGRRSSILPRTRAALVAAFASTHQLRVAPEMQLGQRTVLYPDFVLVTPLDLALRETFPENVRLVVEVADSHLDLCRNEKASVYARAGLPEYWIVNIPQHCLEVYRGPVRGGRHGGFTGWGFASRRILWPADSVMPLDTRDLPLRVADLI